MTNHSSPPSVFPPYQFQMKEKEEKTKEKLQKSSLSILHLGWDRVMLRQWHLWQSTLTSYAKNYLGSDEGTITPPDH